jgi:hypothetical protein
MKKGLIVSLLLGFLLVACGETVPPPVTDGVEYCALAETHLKQLGCIPKDGPYTNKGKSFTQFCQETMGYGINIAPHCLSRINSCDQINRCTAR